MGGKFYGNQQPKYFARRNHLRLVQRVASSIYWGANYDIQKLLIPQIGECLIKYIGEDIFPKFLFYLDLLKVCGLEQYSILNTIIDYITGYTCKRGDNSVIWGDNMTYMLDTYIDKGNDGNVRSLVATLMNNMSKQQSVSRSECMFTLCSGKPKRSSFGFTTICSVNEVDLYSVRDETLLPPPPVEEDCQPTVAVSNQSFVWKDINTMYSTRAASLNTMNLYKYASSVYTKKPVIPQFFGIQTILFGHHQNSIPSGY